MQKDVTVYFEKTVFPLIAESYPEVSPEISIQIRGSYGLDIADEYSDLDAILWLDDPLWKAQGGQVQLMLEHDVPKFGPADILEEHGHAEVCVWPLSWLGHRRGFLDDESEPPWEEVSFEEFYELQNNLVLRDPRGVFWKLKEATAPDRFPDHLWKKLLIQKLKKIDDDITEYHQVVRRGRMVEENIILARVLEKLIHLGFLINRQYYPWSTHLHWAFSQLPVPASVVLPHIENLSYSQNCEEKLLLIDKIKEIYAGYILKERMLSGEIMNDLLWAVRLEAWSKPNWRDWITDCQQRATASGYSLRDSWIWSLWGWK